MDVRKVKKLIELLEESDAVSEIEIREGEEAVRISRASSAVPAAHTPTATAHIPPATAHHQPATSPAPTPTTETASTNQASPTASAEDSQAKTITSPMVGTFYRAPNPDAEPFVKPGDQVKQGQTLCIIEAMKTMNQIEAQEDATIKKVLVEDGEPVEFGQDLFTIES